MIFSRFRIARHGRNGSGTLTGQGFLCALSLGILPAILGVAGRLNRRPARPSLSTVNPSSPSDSRQGRALAIIAAGLLSLLTALPSNAATPAGTAIGNTASATFDAGITVASNTVSIVTVERRTSSTLEFLKLSAGDGGETLSVPGTEYSPSGDKAQPFSTIPVPVPLGATDPVELVSVSLTTGTLYHQGEPIFLRLTDLDQNRDPAALNTVVVTVSVPQTGDTEVLRLYESAPDTGVFLGYLPTGNGGNLSHDGVLSVAEGSDLVAHYTDEADGTDVSTSAALVDPFGFVIDSHTGLPVDGATITLVDASTGRPAVVVGDDGISAFPATIISGATATDAGGKTYNFPPGNYRFPFVSPGSYRLEVTPPSGYAAPSTVPTADLQTLPGAPFAIVGGSRGENFNVDPGPALHIDLPLDPVTGQLWVRKSAGKDRVSTGDFVPYQVTVENPDDDGSATDVTISDRLPPGFRYRNGSARVDGTGAADPEIDADGRTLTFHLGDLAPGAERDLRYVAEVGAGARIGEAVNIASAHSSQGLTSNAALAAVRVEEAFFRGSAILAGRVAVADGCGEEISGGLQGVRIYLEDGTYVVTDKEGRYHFEGLLPGTHVVQLDLDSLPPQYDMLPCEENSRFAGSAYSRFVDLQGGTLWRADFHVGLRPKTRGQVTIALNSTLEGETVVYSIPLQVGGVALGDLRLSVILPEGVEYLPGTSAIDGTAIADPGGFGGVKTYRLDYFPAGRQAEITLSGRVTSGSPAELPTRAVLTFDSPEVKNQRTPMAENLLLQRVETIRETFPGTTLRPHFPTLGAELAAVDKAELDRLADRIRDLNVARLFAIGHTDNVRIAPRSRHLYTDNIALSKARASSVGRYIATVLGLSPAQVVLVGLGDAVPIADNTMPEGRALNRRVEVRVECEKVSEQTVLSLLKDRSGPQRVETVGQRPGEDWLDPGTATEGAGRDGVMPAFDKAWINSAAPGLEWLWPSPEFSPPIPSLKVAFKHHPGERVSLLLEGEEVNALTYEGTLKNDAGSVAVSLWRGIGITEGDNRFELVCRNTAGEITHRLQRTIHYSGPPVKVILAPEKSLLVADSKAPPIVAVRLTDKDGFPAREGVVGDFEVNAPYSAREKREAVSREVEDRADRQQFLVGADGVALIELEPTTRSGEAVLRFRLDGREQEVHAWLRPGNRDWILVGLAEGTLGYSTLSGNMEVLPPGVEDSLYEDGRMAFFAKGRVRGKWLMTVAYDSAKSGRRDESLFQTIDPDSFYTLYGDATGQQYEAASARKLYLKIERDRFYALFGDFDTGLTVTELSRYNRSLNGLKAEMDSGAFTFNIFAADTSQAFVKDEIRGDGTSGLYHLSREKIVLNSEKVTIEVRDRLRSEVVLSSRTLNRHIDYDIDYGDGTLFFKEPIPSRDGAFNPVSIVVDYEAADDADRAFTYGGRGAVRLLGGEVEAGATHIHEGGKGNEGDLYGLDALWKLTEQTELRGEVATSQTDLAGTERKGDAWLAELGHRTPALDANLYFREQETGFGLGQQRGSEEGTRKFGLEGTYRLGDRLSLEGEAYRQVNLETDANREVAESALRWMEQRYTARFGLRQATDTLGDGTMQRSTQALFGGSLQALPHLTLKAEHEQALSSNDASRDFPTRTLLGADYRLTDDVTLFGEQEFTRGENRDTEGTRVGLKATPWNGGQLHSSLERQVDEYGPRMFALYGLKQTWQLSERWSIDGGLDRSHTVSEPGDTPLNEDVPSASGEQEDFVSVSLGGTYRTEKWSWANRIERRDGDSQDKWGIFSGLVGQLHEGLGLSARTQIFLTDGPGSQESTDGDIRLGLAWRPLGGRWIVLERFDFLFDRQKEETGKLSNWRLVNNLNANWRRGRTQVALQYGAKYVQETIFGADYSGFTDLVGLETRYDLTKRWDVGLRGSVLHSWNGGQFDYSTGASLGYNVMKNAWLSLGYNLLGFHDEDFSAAGYTAQGPYLRFRMKFDQHSIRPALRWFTGS